MQTALGLPALQGPVFVSSKRRRPARRLVARSAFRHDDHESEGADNRRPAAWKGALLGAALAPLVVCSASYPASFIARAVE